MFQYFIISCHPKSPINTNENFQSKILWPIKLEMVCRIKLEIAVFNRHVEVSKCIHTYTFFFVLSSSSYLHVLCSSRKRRMAAQGSVLIIKRIHKQQGIPL